MTLDWRETLGNWNPQLARELRGRLTLRNMLLAATLAIACQIGVSLLWNLNARPGNSIFSPSCQLTPTQWLQPLGAAATRSHLTSRSPRLQPVRQPDRR